jgi:hypothetical protein
MKTITWAITVSMLGVIPIGRAVADGGSTQSLHQPNSLRQTGLGDDYYYSFSTTAQDQAAESPSDQPAPEVAGVTCNKGGCAACGCDSCGESCCNQSCDGCSCCCDAWSLPQPCFLACRGITLSGWLAQGITWNPDEPVNRFNGPVTFNDRSNEYQLNQLYLYAERQTCTGGCGVDVGGRVDLMYGTDHRFAVTRGLDDDWNQDERFYGLSMPQAYLDVAYDNLTIRAGHFYTILGYEQVAAPNNFFYSRSYTMQYGEPFTHTGVLFTYGASSRLSMTLGFDRGWNNWEDNNDELSYLGAVNWASCDGRTTLGLGFTYGDEDDAGVNNRTLFSLVFSRMLSNRLQYVLQYDCGWEENAAAQGTQDAEWYGVVNYLFYELNPCWTVGMRYEWFADDDGVRVTSDNTTGGPPKGMYLSGVASQWSEIALGLNWTPNANVLVRTELRWDWVDPLVTVTDAPFDDYNSLDQFLLGTDLIITY